MCLIIANTSGDKLDRSIIARAHWENKDGAGLMFACQGDLYIEKPLWKIDDIYDAYCAALEMKDEGTPVVLHFRLATSGHLDFLNTHPHILCKGTVGLAHNGVMSRLSDLDEESDTVQFCELVLYGRPRSQIMSEGWKQRMEFYLDGWNKFCLLDKEGNLQLWNESYGVWKDGDWYSSDSLFRTYTVKGYSQGYEMYKSENYLTHSDEKGMESLTDEELESDTLYGRDWFWHEHTLNKEK